MKIEGSIVLVVERSWANLRGVRAIIREGREIKEGDDSHIIEAKVLDSEDTHGLWVELNDGKAVVGIVEIIKPYYPDPSDETGKFGMVDIRAIRPLPREVTLEAVKAEKRLAKMALVTLSRLSVQPVTEAEWKIVCAMGGL